MPLLASRVIAVFILSFFGFQLIRGYLVVPLDAYVCSSPDHDHDGTSPNGHHHEDEEALSQSVDQGNSLQHCKDTLDGLGLIPMEAFGPPVTISRHHLAATWISVAGQNPSPIEIFLPSPFQPPKNLS